MPDFRHVQAPVFSPTQCITCLTSTHKDGFVDLLAELGPPHGRLYMCAGCVLQAGRQVGMLEPKQASDLTRRLADAEARADALEQQLADERDNKVISLEDARRLISPRGGYTRTPAA